LDLKAHAIPESIDQTQPEVITQVKETYTLLEGFFGDIIIGGINERADVYHGIEADLSEQCCATDLGGFKLNGERYIHILKTIRETGLGSEGIEFIDPVEVQGILEQKASPGEVPVNPERKGIKPVKVIVEPHSSVKASPNGTGCEMGLFRMQPGHGRLGVDHEPERTLFLLGRKPSMRKEQDRNQNWEFGFHGVSKNFSIFNV
jgi:hypothetical protein